MCAAALMPLPHRLIIISKMCKIDTFFLDDLFSKQHHIQDIYWSNAGTYITLINHEYQCCLPSAGSPSSMNCFGFYLFIYIIGYSVNKTKASRTNLYISSFCAVIPVAVNSLCLYSLLSYLVLNANSLQCPQPYIRGGRVWGHPTLKNSLGFIEGVIQFFWQKGRSQELSEARPQQQNTARVTLDGRSYMTLCPRCFVVSFFFPRPPARRHAAVSV